MRERGAVGVYCGPEGCEEGDEEGGGKGEEEGGKGVG